MMNHKYDRLKAILMETACLAQTASLLNWDRETLMPPGGAESRANQLALLDKLYHERFTSDEMGHLLEELSSEQTDFDPDSDEARIVQVTKRDYDLERKIPVELVEEMSRASSEGVIAWRKAKEAQDFSHFAPYLRHNIDINRRVAEVVGYDERPYDAFLKYTEPGITADQLDVIFSELKAAIVPLLREIATRQDVVDDSLLHQQFDTQKQLGFALEIAQRYGYDLQRGRLDRSPHPFMTKFGPGDVRITTRVFPDFLNACLFATMHEAGHAMYEQGVSRSLAYTPAGQGASGGVHESQSRLWENLVGRSRPFQDFLFPRLQETFPQQLGNADVDAFYRAINKVQPSLIRVEADEVTYNLHILLRYELENEMLEEKVDIEKLDEVWRERIEQYLGITPSNDAEGVLQDIHWSQAGGFSFPTYTLGNIIGAQLFDKAHAAMPDLDEQIARGEFSALLGWLRTNLYQHGRKFTPNELVERITGQPIGTVAWTGYVQRKFSEIYEL